MRSRRLTVSRQYPESRAAQPRSVRAPMPFLRLRGRWLDEAGFRIGAHVRIAVSRGRLALEVVELEPQPQELEPSRREAVSTRSHRR
jgi:hypothetical protein